MNALDETQHEWVETKYARLCNEIQDHMDAGDRSILMLRFGFTTAEEERVKQSNLIHWDGSLKVLSIAREKKKRIAPNDMALIMDILESRNEPIRHLIKKYASDVDQYLGTSGFVELK